MVYVTDTDGVDVTMVCVTRCVTFPIITPPRPETTEKRLDLTGYMSYNDAEGRGPWWPTAFSIILAHMARQAQPFLSRF
jgi:hypothetical protein